MIRLKLKKGFERRALGGHLWIYSNEVDQSSPLPENGADVTVTDHQGRVVGSGVYSANSLISVRLHARGGDIPLDGEFFKEKLSIAINLRTHLLGSDFKSCRVVFGEADSLPGVVVDRYGDYLSVQLGSFGAEARAEMILDALLGTFSPRGIVLRNDSPSREHEGLSKYVKVARGEVAPQVEFPYLGMTLSADLLTGQKTGFFFDQRLNYRLLENIAGGARVLDGFCYSGGWGLNALKYGAECVDFLDISQSALKSAKDNVERNGFGAPVNYVAADCFEFFKGKPTPYDLVVVDPPAFVKSRKKLAEGVKGYINLFKWGMRAVSPGGFIIICSCSHHIRPPEFTDIAAIAARESGRTTRVVGVGRQAPDHPWLPSMPETDYLKVLLLQVD